MIQIRAVFYLQTMISRHLFYFSVVFFSLQHPHLSIDLFANCKIESVPKRLNRRKFLRKYSHPFTLLLRTKQSKRISAHFLNIVSLFESQSWGFTVIYCVASVHHASSENENPCLFSQFLLITIAEDYLEKCKLLKMTTCARTDIQTNRKYVFTCSII